MTEEVARKALARPTAAQSSRPPETPGQDPESSARLVPGSPGR